MKKVLLVFLFNIFVGYIVFNSINNNPKNIFTELNLSTGKEPVPDQRPDEWAYIKKTYPYYKADADVYIKAIEQAKKLKAETLSKRLSKGLQAVQWQFAGPTNVGGRVVDIEFDPTNPSIVYAGWTKCIRW